jgi:hypothetical protein
MLPRNQVSGNRNTIQVQYVKRLYTYWRVMLSVKLRLCVIEHLVRKMCKIMKHSSKKF